MQQNLFDKQFTVQAIITVCLTCHKPFDHDAQGKNGTADCPDCGKGSGWQAWNYDEWDLLTRIGFLPSYEMPPLGEVMTLEDDE